ncbi:MAG: hypothetical protein M1834_002171 [Cirrosporium novae-zelandiae]|nr:MAG: hypothetical protein M1834_002171 [Cirrosporium novae-zelandiae]
MEAWTQFSDSTSYTSFATYPAPSHRSYELELDELVRMQQIPPTIRSRVLNAYAEADEHDNVKKPPKKVSFWKRVFCCSCGRS